MLRLFRVIATYATYHDISETPYTPNHAQVRSNHTRIVSKSRSSLYVRYSVQLAIMLYVPATSLEICMVDLGSNTSHGPGTDAVQTTVQSTLRVIV